MQCVFSCKVPPTVRPEILTNDNCPFQLNLNHPTAADPECLTTLRHLPGRRLVCSGTWGDEQVVVKLFEGKNAQRYWEREKRGINLLQQRGIATPALLFAGTLGNGRHVLISKMLPHSVTAKEQWENCKTDTQRSSLLLRLTTVIAQLHERGLWQKDLHLGNFLICDNEVFTLDGDAIKALSRDTPLPPRIRRRNLALFLAQIPPPYDHLLENVLRQYSVVIGQNPKPWETVLTRELPLQRKKRRLNYVKKSFRNCTEFVRQRSAGRLIIYRKDAPQELVEQLNEDPEALIEQGEILKDGNSATVVHLHSAQGDWMIKRYNIKNIWHGLGRCMRPTRAAMSWGNAHRLKISGINTPQAIAMVEKRFGPLRFTGYYVCRYIEAPYVTKYFNICAITENERMRTVEAVAQMFEIFFNLGIYHGDCKASNFLIKDEAPWVIDLDSMREFKSRERFLRYYEKDRARFLRNWLPENEIRSWFAAALPRS